MNTSALHAAGFGPLGFALVFLVAAVGALAVHLTKRNQQRTGALPTPEDAKVPLAPLRQEGLPDWSHADVPLLNIAELEAIVLAAAVKAEIDPATLPKFAPPDGSEGAFVFRDKFDYIYAYYEHGMQTSETASAVADELAFRIVADRAWMKAYLASANLGLDETKRTEQVVREQGRMLGAVDSAWAKQAAWEREFKENRA